MSQDSPEEARQSIGISELPVDELIAYGREFGLRLDAKMGQGELLRRIRERQELLLGLDHEALLDIVVWARCPVRKSASKEELAKAVASITKMDAAGLSVRGLVALARLRGVPASEDEPPAVIQARMQANEGFWDRLRRKRREAAGALISKMINGPADQDSQEYRFLPEEGGAPSLKERITEEGVVGGIASKLRGVADDYVREKLDEIEVRIDRKLDEIDRRLAEWRDREVANRLRIIKITLIASILVALLSYGYSCLKGIEHGGSEGNGQTAAVVATDVESSRIETLRVGLISHV